MLHFIAGLLGLHRPSAPAAQPAAQSPRLVRTPRVNLPADATATLVDQRATWLVDLCVHPCTGAASGDDVALIRSIPDGMLLALADGAGSRGVSAPRVLMDVLEERVAGLAGHLSGIEMAKVLVEVDAMLDHEEHGTTTAIIALVAGGAVTLVSAGDSSAWLDDGTDLVELTRGQERTRLGAGISSPGVRGPYPLAGPLILGSDGLYRYLWPEHAFGSVAAAGGRAALALMEAVHSKRERLPDDFSAIVVRPAD